MSQIIIQPRTFSLEDLIKCARSSQADMNLTEVRKSKGKINYFIVEKIVEEVIEKDNPGYLVKWRGFKLVY